MLINVLNLTSLTFAFILSYICMCGSGSWKLLNTDPDPQHWLAVRVNLSQLHGGKDSLLIMFLKYICRIWYLRYLPVFRIRICTDPHKEMPPRSGSAWTDADPDPGGKKA